MGVEHPVEAIAWGIRHDIYPARGRKRRSRKKAKVESNKNDSSPYQHKLTNQNPS